MRLWYFLPSVNHSSNAHVQPSRGARCLIFGAYAQAPLARLRVCAGLPEPSLVAYVIVP